MLSPFGATYGMSAYGSGLGALDRDARLSAARSDEAGITASGLDRYDDDWDDPYDDEEGGGLEGGGVLRGEERYGEDDGQHAGHDELFRTDAAGRNSSWLEQGHLNGREQMWTARSSFLRPQHRASEVEGARLWEEVPPTTNRETASQDSPRSWRDAPWEGASSYTADGWGQEGQMRMKEQARSRGMCSAVAGGCGC